MSFYSSISQYYDEIFPVHSAELNFINSHLKNAYNILDIGCGTGNKSIHFASLHRNITAIDGDADMIAQAQKNHAAPGIKYQVIDMTKIAHAFSAASFDAALCLGNTLVHIQSISGISTLLSGIHKLLKPAGKSIIQILNYKRILQSEANLTLPTLETDNIRFERSYTFFKGQMNFTSRLLVKSTGKVIQNSIPLYPLKKEELGSVLREAGFSEPIYYGSYTGEPLTEESFVLIAVADKTP